MDLRDFLSLAEEIGFPRTRGDGPVLSLFAGGYITFPPHARGWTLPLVVGAGAAIVSPARAGMDLIKPEGGLTFECFPRTRGDGPLFQTVLRKSAMFPPHARGWTPGALAGRQAWPVSPARAGMDLVREDRETLIAGFPRTRGDGPGLGGSRPLPRPFPPHARGWTLVPPRGEGGSHVSPARAGMDRDLAAHEHHKGSFPRTRGDGPRGTHSGTDPSAFPPHARGWTGADPAAPEGRLVSPARAGMDPAGQRIPASQARFPRTRGDGPLVPNQVHHHRGFPPHARGWTCVLARRV